jgi:bifunctional UDP-N-acetylglucosamine pyrophosphorylase/glucosamine-1-phosphate N-acetyltransferase
VKGDEPERLEGLDDRAMFARTEDSIRESINRRHLEAGVTIRHPASAFIDATVELAEDVTIEPNVILRGTTRIGRDSTIGAGSQIVDSVIGERCTVWASILEGATVEDEVAIGPLSHLRPGARVGRGAQVGNFAEIKQSRLGARSKQHHFSYVGDADVGEDVNIGAGTVTANFDGRRKHRTVIADHAFIGSDTILRAPVTIGEGASTGAGSVVTRDVPPGTVAMGVPARVRERSLAADAGTADGPSRDGREETREGPASG